MNDCTRIDDAEQWYHDVFVTTLRQMSGLSYETMKPWYNGPGLGATHYSGLPAYRIRSLKILKPGKRKGPTVVLGAKRKLLAVMPSSPKLLKQVQAVVAVGRVLLQAKLPKTLAQWKCECERCQSLSLGTPGLSSPTTYMTLWVIRSWLEYKRYASFPDSTKASF